MHYGHRPSVVIARRGRACELCRRFFVGMPLYVHHRHLVIACDHLCMPQGCAALIVHAAPLKLQSALRLLQF